MKPGELESRAPVAAAHRWLVLAAVGVGSLLGSIDTGVVNIALPTIRHEFATSVASAEWVITIYLLATCGLLLSFGRIGDLRGQKRVYVSGFATFVLSSALCGLAPSIAMLVLFRALQGVGASMIHASAPAILTGAFPPAQRGRVLGLQGMMTYLGLMIGPMLGGWLTDALSWRAAFYINVPVGALALVLSIKFIPHTRPAKSADRFDFAGAVLFFSAFSVLLIALNQGHERGWTSPYIAKMFAWALLLLVVFVLTESRVASPLLDLTLFRARVFSLTVVSAICNYLAVFAFGFLMPFYLIQERGMRSGPSGLLLAIQPALMIIVAPASGAISDRVGTRRPTVLAMALLAVGMFLLSRLNSASSLVYIGTAIGFVGLGNGVFVAPNNSALMGSAPKHRQGIAAGVMATARYIGMILGVGISGAIFTTALHSQAPGAFFAGIHISFLVASAVSCLGCITSAIRK
jgi:EmrB/QacA subfamily drug resistance transporter